MKKWRIYHISPHLGLISTIRNGRRNRSEAYGFQKIIPTKKRVSDTTKDSRWGIKDKIEEGDEEN